MAVYAPSFWEQMLPHLYMIFWFLSLIMLPITASAYKKKRLRKSLVIIVAVMFEIFPLAIVAAIVMYLKMDFTFSFEVTYLLSWPFKAVMWAKSLNYVKKADQSLPKETQTAQSI